MGKLARVALDSNCLSYLLDALHSHFGPDPSDPLYEQKLALVRIMLYDEWGLYVTPMTKLECDRIPHAPRAQMHGSWLSSILSEVQPINQKQLAARIEELNAAHPDADDCRVIAECEDAGVRILLTYDRQLLTHLTATARVRLLQPLDYWSELRIPKGARPKTLPAPGNPLLAATWWQWE